MKASELEHIFTELIAIYENLKAETVIAELKESLDISPHDFVISNKSTFSRPYRRDIISVDDVTYDQCLNLNLSRNGLYDQLPQGLFHKDTADQKNLNFSEKRKQFKKEEHYARLFFSPVENEFFYQRLKVEVTERQLLDEFYSLTDTFLLDFWNIKSDLPREYLVKLIKVLPFCYKISGDLELTRQCLEKILEEPVEFNLTYSNRKPGKQTSMSDNNFQLGMDMTLESDEAVVHNPVLEVCIGPISPHNIDNYLKKDGILIFINKFYDYFIPLELDVDTKFTSTMSEGFMLDEINSPLMGVTTMI